MIMAKYKYAFPRVGSNGIPGQPGMTLRDYFAAHAPALPSEAYSVVYAYPVIPDEPKCNFETEDEREDWSSALAVCAMTGGGTPHPSMMNYKTTEDHAKMVLEWEKNKRRLEAQAEINAHAKWAYFYADAMLAARGVRL